MREVQRRQMQFGQVAIGDIWLDPKSRDDIPAVESAINALEHRGLDRVRTRGAEGFERTVALSVLAANLHRLGRLLRQRERKRRRRAA